MHISTGGGNGSQLMQLAQNLSQGQNGHFNFQAELNQQNAQSSTAPNGTTAATNGGEGTSNGNPAGTQTGAQGTGNGAGASGAATASMFNTMGNLSSTTNLKDFGLLASQQTMLNQINLLNQSIHHTQLAALQPATFAQLSIVLKMFDQALQRYKQSQRLQHALGASSAEAQQASEESKLLLIAFLERCNKILEQPKNIALSRFFKKGPLGENLHEEDTDDEYGSVYNDVDAEIDYIKRFRRLRQDMLFHYSMIT